MIERTKKDQSTLCAYEKYVCHISIFCKVGWNLLLSMGSTSIYNDKIIVPLSRTNSSSDLHKMKYESSIELIFK